MSTATKDEVSILSNPTVNIPALAIQAASELDDILASRAEASPASKKLGEVLLLAIQGRKNGTSPASIRSGTVAVFSHALEQLPLQHPISSMADLVSVATEISQELSVSKPPSEVMRLKQFCIALARASSRYRPAIDSYDPQLARR
jgi:hypothetical protein